MLVALRQRPVKVYDNARVVVVGSFCEQPPQGLIKTLEQSGCDIVSDDFTPAAVYNLSKLPAVKEVRPRSRNEVRVHVEDAGSTIPLLIDAMKANNCSISNIAEYKPTFDEVFIELMNRDADITGEGEADEDAG